MRCNKCGAEITQNSNYCNKCGNSVTSKNNIKTTGQNNSLRIYDYDSLHPNAKKISLVLLGICTLASFVGALITRGYFILITCFLVSVFFFYRSIVNLSKCKRIIFTDNSIKISWTSLKQSIEESVNSSEIKKVELGTYSEGKNFVYTLEIYTSSRLIKFQIDIIQRIELKEYFKWFCEINGIELII